MAITRYSVDDYEEMIRRGVLTENDRVELIRGEIVAKMPVGDRHLAGTNRFNRLLQRRVGDAAIVSVQNPIRLAESEPEPDISLLPPRQDDYASGKPGASDVLLLAEVSDWSLHYDRDVKRPLDAEAGITEFWIVNLVDECLEVYRDPQPDRTYRFERVLRRGDSTDIAAPPGVIIAVDDVL